MNPWGYSTCGDEIPPMLTVSEFRRITGNKLVSDDATVAATLAATSAAVRGWCGWHVSPTLNCVYIGEPQGRLIRLPAMGVNVERVEVKGQVLDESAYEWTAQGLVRLLCAPPVGWRSVAVAFTAGFEVADEIGGVVAQIASNALAASPGIAEEHAGQVGINYNQTASGVSGGLSLLERDLMMLAPYRLTRV